jgi:hypothetical protein
VTECKCRTIVGGFGGESEETAIILCPSCREALTNGRRAIDFLKRFLDDCRAMPYEAPGHMCRYRVVLEALAQRAKEVVE